MPNSLPDFMTQQEVADLLRVPISSVRAWMRAGDLKSFRVGRYTRTTMIEVNKFLENRQTTK